MRRSFPLISDPGLQQGGITIIARVEVVERMVKNRIIFRRDGKEASVDCVHTAIYHGPAAEILDADSPDKVVERAIIDDRLDAGDLISLPPEEHFVSLKSYVQGIAEMGIGNMLRASYASESVNPLAMPFGFNSDMQIQVMRAIRTLDLAASNHMVLDLLLHLFETIPEEWLHKRFAELDRTYDFGQALFIDLGNFSSVFEAMPRDWFAQWAFTRKPPTDIKQFLIIKGFQSPSTRVNGVPMDVNETDWTPAEFDVQGTRDAAVNAVENAFERAATDARIRLRVEVRPVNEEMEDLHTTARETRRAFEELRNAILRRLRNQIINVVDINNYRDPSGLPIHLPLRHWFLVRKGGKKYPRSKFRTF